MVDLAQIAPGYKFRELACGCLGYYLEYIRVCAKLAALEK